MSEGLAWFIFSSIMLLPPIINIIIAPYLDFYTKPENESIIDNHQYGFVFLFFGIFLLPFRKKIRKYRMMLYLQEQLNTKKNDLDKLLNVVCSASMYVDEIGIEKLKKDIFRLERKIKLEKLKK
jgi:hypothetical protein